MDFTWAKAANADGGDAPPTGIMVALMVPTDIAQGLVVPNGLPAEELHITLAYLGPVDAQREPIKTLADLLDTVRAVGMAHGPVNGQISGVGRFSLGEQGDVFYLSYDSPELETLRRDLLDALAGADLQVVLNHGYVPHISLTYLAAGDRSPLNRIDAIPLAFDEVTVAWGGNRIQAPLTGGAVEPMRTQPIEGIPTPAGLKVAQLALTPELLNDALAQAKIRLDEAQGTEREQFCREAIKLLELAGAE
jgi:2'-5' RNA ligase